MANILLGALGVCTLLLFCWLVWQWVGLFDVSYTTPAERQIRRYRVVRMDDGGTELERQWFCCLRDACIHAEAVMWPRWTTPTVIDEQTGADVYGHDCGCARCKK